MMATKSFSVPDMRMVRARIAQNGRLLRLATSLLILKTASSMTAVAVPIFAIERYGLTLDTGLLFGAGILPNVLFGYVAGSLVDKWNPLKVAILAASAGAAAVAVFPLTDQLWQLQLLFLFIGFAFMIGFPAYMALRPRVMEPGSELSGTSILVTAERLATVIGPAVAPLIIVGGGVSWVFFAEAIGAAISALLLAGMDLTKPGGDADQAQPDDAGPAQKNAFVRLASMAFSQFREAPAELSGLIRSDRFVFVLTVTAIPYSIAVGLRTIFIARLAQEIVPTTGGMLGYLMAALGLGGVAGGFFVTWAKRISPGVLFLAVNVLEGVCWIVIFLHHSPAWTLVVCGLAGLFEAAGTVIFFAEVQRRIPEDRIGRYFASIIPFTECSVLAGTVAAPVVVSRLGLVETGTLMALLMAVPVAAAARVFVHGYGSDAPPTETRTAVGADRREGDG